MGRHTEAIARITCPWRKVIAVVTAFITAGTFVPYAYTVRAETPAEAEDEEFSVPALVHETHSPVSWPAVSLVHPNRPTSTGPSLRKPTDHTPQKQHNPPPVSVPVNPRPRPVVHPVIRSDSAILVAFLRAQLGERYVLGGNGPDVWDCSGLARAAYLKIGISLPRTSQLQSLRGTRVSMSQLRVGDLLFWGVPGLAYHVAIYVGGGKYIAAQNPSVGVVERTIPFSPPDFARRIL